MYRWLSDLFQAVNHVGVWADELEKAWGATSTREKQAADMAKWPDARCQSTLR